MSDVDIAKLIVKECAAAHAAQDVKERALDEHGYGGKAPVDPAQITGLDGYIPALRLYSDELGALRHMLAELVKFDRQLLTSGEVRGSETRLTTRQQICLRRETSRILAIAKGSE